MSPRPVAHSRPTRVTVDLAALRHNWRLTRQAAGTARVMAVVKADAYGHGAVPVAQTLQAAGCRDFCVAALEEALQLRAAGIQGGILVLGSVDPKHLGEAVRAKIGLTFWSRDFLRQALRALPKAGVGRQPLLAHLKVDTGMSRLGFPLHEVPGVLADFARGRFKGAVLSSGYMHFACADDPSNPFSARQLAAFTALPWPKDLCLHAANSAALLTLPAARLCMARSGILLYGAADPSLSPLAAAQRPVLSLSTQVIALHDLAPGVGVSYGSTFITRRRTRVATLPIGYADGMPRSLSNRATVLLGGKPCPVLGRVCMDLCMIDATLVPAARVGSPAVLIGRQGKASVTAGQWAELAGTIPYEILCQLSARLPRQYKGAGRV